MAALRLLASTQAADAAGAVAAPAGAAKALARASASVAAMTVLYNFGRTDIGAFLPGVNDERNNEYRPAPHRCQSDMLSRDAAPAPANYRASRPGWPTGLAPAAMQARHPVLAKYPGRRGACPGPGHGAARRGWRPVSAAPGYL